MDPRNRGLSNETRLRTDRNVESTRGTQSSARAFTCAEERLARNVLDKMEEKYIKNIKKRKLNMKNA